MASKKRTNRHVPDNDFGGETDLLRVTKLFAANLHGADGFQAHALGSLVASLDNLVWHRPDKDCAFLSNRNDERLVW